jgi:hypothetical protein
MSSLCVATLLVVAFAAPAVAAPPDIIHGSITIPFSDPGPIPDDCRPGITGSIAGTDVFTFYNVRGDNAWHVNLVRDETATVTWSDGSYTTLTSTEHATWNRLTGWFTVTHRETGNTYSGSGDFLFRTALKSVERAYLNVDYEGFLEKFEKVYTNAWGGCPAFG